MTQPTSNSPTEEAIFRPRYRMKARRLTPASVLAAWLSLYHEFIFDAAPDGFEHQSPLASTSKRATTSKRAHGQSEPSA
jgi:hypothetical protein